MPDWKYGDVARQSWGVGPVPSQRLLMFIHGKSPHASGSAMWLVLDDRLASGRYPIGYVGSWPIDSNIIVLERLDA